jgi:hypothetical protein
MYKRVLVPVPVQPYRYSVATVYVWPIGTCTGYLLHRCSALYHRTLAVAPARSTTAMPKVVLTFKDCEKWEHYVVTQGAEVRSIITFRSARLNACEARTEYLTYWFMLPRMPTFDASYFPQVVEDDSPSYKVTCLLVGNTLKNKRYWVVPDAGDVERARAKFEFARYDYEQSLKYLARCYLNLDNNLEDSDYFETKEDEPDPPVDGIDGEGEYVPAGDRVTRIAARQYFQGRVGVYIEAVKEGRYMRDTLRERCSNWENHWHQTLHGYRDGTPPGSISVTGRKRKRGNAYDALVAVPRRSFHAKILAIRKDAILP